MTWHFHAWKTLQQWSFSNQFSNGSGVIISLIFCFKGGGEGWNHRNLWACTKSTKCFLEFPKNIIQIYFLFASGRKLLVSSLDLFSHFCAQQFTRFSIKFCIILIQRSAFVTEFLQTTYSTVNQQNSSSIVVVKHA